VYEKCETLRPKILEKISRIQEEMKDIYTAFDQSQLDPSILQNHWFAQLDQFEEKLSTLKGRLVLRDRNHRSGVKNQKLNVRSS